MDNPPHLSRTKYQLKIRRTVILLLLLIGLLTTGVLATDTWHPFEVRPWVQVDIPSGWSASSEENETTSPDSAVITVYAPDDTTRLVYILDHSKKEMTKKGIQKFQKGQMSKLGFRVCLTKDPIIIEKSGNISYQQTYVRGTDDAAVIGTRVEPGWGQVHYILVMEGPQAVADYYESVPALMQDHIRPVFTDPGSDTP